MNKGPNFIKMEKALFEWRPHNILNIDSTGLLYACILINRPILFDSSIFQSLWNNATVRVLVDGGANRWFEFIDKYQLKDTMKDPSYVCGDMDSITEESIQRLDTMNVELLHTPDQDETDLVKALKVSEPFVNSHNIMKLLILTDYSGRIDQLMSQINALYKNQTTELYLMSHNTLAWVLRPGTHRLTIPDNLVEEQIWCSYIPFGSACRVTTHGLKYDLCNGIVSFSGLISTSNTYESASVQIECEDTVFWAMGTEKEAY